VGGWFEWNVVSSLLIGDLKGLDPQRFPVISDHSVIQYHRETP
jgi:hypothetical protein